MPAAESLQLLVDNSISLAGERSVDAIAERTLEAARALCGATIGVFFYSAHGDHLDAYEACKVCGIDAALLGERPVPWPSSPSEEAVSNHKGILCIADVLAEARFAENPPFPGLAPEHLVVRSYLSVEVRGRGDNLLGSMFFGHRSPGVFVEAIEPLIATIASQAAAAIESARIAASLSAQIAIAGAAQELQSITAKRLRQALDAGRMGTFTWDRASDMLDLDERAAELFHAAPNVPISRSLLRERTVIPEDRETTLRQLRSALETGDGYTAEYRVAAPDGSVSWVCANGISTSAQGGISGMTGIVQDITERKNQEAALRQSEKLAATGRLAATIAHEINNPLEAVTNLLYLVKTDPELPEHLVEMMATADAELARVGQIAQQTLGFYRDSSTPVEVDLSALLSAVSQLFARKLGLKRLQCTLDLEPKLRLIGFAGEMRQIFSNLLVNAIDATPSGTIHLRARSRNYHGNPGVVITVSDPGSGIPRHMHRRMFTPFFTTKDEIGTGLGLWVTRGMVEKHGGKIGFRSRTEQPSGTVFRVHLPQAFAGTAYSSSPRATPIQ